MSNMRAKFQISSIQQFEHSEKLNFYAVASKGYPADGSDEDNTYAKFSPQADCSITIANPAMIGTFKVGQKFYVDFTEAE